MAPPPVILSMFFYDRQGEPDKARRTLMRMPYVKAVTVQVDVGMILVEGPTNATVAELVRARLQEKMRRAVTIVSNVGPQPETSGWSPGPPPSPRPSGYPPPRYPPPPPPSPPPMAQYFPPPPPAAPYGYHSPVPPPPPAAHYGYHSPASPQYATPPAQESDEYQWVPYNREHVYTPSYFSDDNPNNCSIQ